MTSSPGFAENAADSGDMRSGGAHDARPIDSRERAGVLHPQNLERYEAQWFAPDAAIAEVVETYWSVRWRFTPGESIEQRIVSAPAVNLTIESGDVPAPLVVTGVHERAWKRQIRGWGEVFAVRLRPAGLAVVSDIRASSIADLTVPLTPGLDARAHRLLSAIAAETTLEARAAAADRAIRSMLGERPVDARGRLANEVVHWLGSGAMHTDGSTRSPRSRADESPARPAAATVAARFGVSQRTIQRSLADTLGRGPKWVTRCVRLQEVTRSLSMSDHPDVAAIAAQLGYTDQAHLVNDFRSAVGITPGAYVRSLRELRGG